MYRASAYNRSQDTLIKFAKKFNSLSVQPNLYCCPILAETMLNDGCFVDVNVGKLFSFDWEIREKLQSFKPGEFAFSTLTEFERKFKPEKHTQLFIQCDNQERYIAVAWRKDFMANRAHTHSVAADNGRQFTERRETEYFQVYDLEKLEEFKLMLSKAIQSSTYQHEAFSL